MCDFKSTSVKEMRMHNFKIHKHKLTRVSSAAPFEDTVSDVIGEEEIGLKGDEVSKVIRRSSNADNNEIIFESDSDMDVSLEKFVINEDLSVVTMNDQSIIEKDSDK